MRSITQVNFLRGATTSLKVLDSLSKPDKIVNHMKGIKTSKEGQKHSIYDTFNDGIVASANPKTIVEQVGGAASSRGAGQLTIQARKNLRYQKKDLKLKVGIKSLK